MTMNGALVILALLILGLAGTALILSVPGQEEQPVRQPSCGLQASLEASRRLTFTGSPELIIVEVDPVNGTIEISKRLAGGRPPHVEPFNEGLLYEFIIRVDGRLALHVVHSLPGVTVLDSSIGVEPGTHTIHAVVNVWGCSP